MIKFDCIKCGKCCINLQLNKIYESLDRGDGICMFFDESTRLCTIYESRPIICNIEKYYETYLKYKISRIEFYKLNKEACKTLQNKGD